MMRSHDISQLIILNSFLYENILKYFFNIKVLKL